MEYIPFPSAVHSSSNPLLAPVPFHPNQPSTRESIALHTDCSNSVNMTSNVVVVIAFRVVDKADVRAGDGRSGDGLSSPVVEHDGLGGATGAPLHNGQLSKRGRVVRMRQ